MKSLIFGTVLCVVLSQVLANTSEVHNYQDVFGLRGLEECKEQLVLVKDAFGTWGYLNEDWVRYLKLAGKNFKECRERGDNSFLQCVSNAAQLLAMTVYIFFYGNFIGAKLVVTTIISVIGKCLLGQKWLLQ